MASGNNRVWANSYSWYYHQLDTVLARNEVNFVSERSYYLKKGSTQKKKLLQSNSRYDSKGRLIEEWSVSKKGKTNNLAHYTYDQDNRVIKAEFGTHPRKKSVYLYTYNQSGKILEYKYIYKNRLLELKRYNYADDSKLKSSYFYKKDTSTARYTFFSWYENDTGRLIRSEERNKKGKLIYRWDYTCDPKGEIVKQEPKKESMVCRTHTKLPNGNTQYVYENRDANGFTRIISEFDSLNRNVSYTDYRGKFGNQLRQISEYTYSESGVERLTRVYHLKKSILDYSYITRKNALGQTVYTLTRHYEKKERLKWSWETNYIYTGNLLTLTTSANLRNRDNEKITEFEYGFSSK